MKRIEPEVWFLAGDGALGRTIAQAAEEQGVVVRFFRDVSQALDTPEPEGGVVLVIDADSGYPNYLTIIRRFGRKILELETAVFGPARGEEVVEGEYDRGVDRYVATPVSDDDCLARITHMIAVRRVKSSAGIIGRSRQVASMIETILQVAPTEVSVLIEGESGSGKELAARAIHLMSRRSGASFEAINCGSLAEGILESELFGHERGSFTGAVSQHLGLFERADRGTLFLDEVGETSLNMQVRLLRVIETGDFVRVGGTKKIHTDVRLIAATNRSLETAVERGDFREDLFYRLKVVLLRVPPLRSREGDIPLLVDRFMRLSARKHGKTVKGIEEQGMEMLNRYAWPGNVRELHNTIDNLVVLSRDDLIRAADVRTRLEERMSTQSVPDLPVRVEKSREEMERELIINSLLSLHNGVREILGILRGDAAPRRAWGRWTEVPDARDEQARDLETLEREAIREALDANRGNRRKTAKQLGISERTLYRRLKDYGLA
ncbi:MAG: sigma-54-dependent Fis family transcriptional regulator [Candidatus Krumholzibacteriota bacterium]|nr:sigma-54-dependent Fis family transcriptional regulator [Candidatus Krumholzibacteriota bacterium]